MASAFRRWQPTVSTIRERVFVVAGLFAASALRALLWALCGCASFRGWRQWVGGLVG
ncbi:hypothetical protein HMPREF1978_00949 [Actinomyces graevenitzii F0530]|uniref:Uncharacterized protein n=1 Tax=Actinomyces graevenitzii F0530 TaxID=1321817 RepID=U1RDA0_9ACTO|nr:hypothetical protein HMPREF1978_00949 [Actinomyces graevenitzii F0530]